MKNGLIKSMNSEEGLFLRHVPDTRVRPLLRVQRVSVMQVLWHLYSHWWLKRSCSRTLHVLALPSSWLLGPRCTLTLPFLMTANFTINPGFYLWSSAEEHWELGPLSFAGVGLWIKAFPRAVSAWKIRAGFVVVWEQRMFSIDHKGSARTITSES